MNIPKIMWAIAFVFMSIFYGMVGVYAIKHHNYVGGIVCCLMAYIEGWSVHYEINE